MRSGSDEIAVLPLGPAVAIERLITAWRDLVARPPRTTLLQIQADHVARVAGERLREHVWDPLVPFIAGTARVFVVPDGALNLVNFSALPIDRERYLVDDFRILHYLTSEKDLVGNDAISPGLGLLAVGGAAFGEEPVVRSPLPSTASTGRAGREVTRPAAPTNSDTDSRRSGCADFRPIHFEPLAGTRDEVLEISRMWSSAVQTPVTVLTGSAADQRSVQTAAMGREVVHLATHGFFLNSGCSSNPRGTRGVGGLATGPEHEATETFENPLLLAGLALANANRRNTADKEEDDGILTAEEVAGLNLQGTQWAVLSACDTGLGEIRAGEGVFGLRRAFQIAGARTVIMSLWSVEDRATRDWMRALYDARLRRQLDTVESVAHASRTVLAGRRAKGQSTHPFYWAAFVAAGDWR